ncbi:hypothetical protein AAY473_037023 [Plecturocebus cupreus]
MSQRLRPRRAVCPAAAAQEWASSLGSISGGSRGPLAGGPELQRRSRAGAGPGGLSGQENTRSRGLPGNAPLPWRPSRSRPSPARSSLLAIPKLAGAPSLTEPGPDVPVTAAKPGSLPSSGCKGVGTGPQSHPQWPRRASTSAPVPLPRRSGAEPGPGRPSSLEGCAPAASGSPRRAQENPPPVERRLRSGFRSSRARLSRRPMPNGFSGLTLRGRRLSVWLLKAVVDRTGPRILSYIAGLGLDRRFVAGWG